MDDIERRIRQALASPIPRASPLPATSSNWASRDFAGAANAPATRFDTSYRQQLPQHQQRRGLADDVGEEASPDASFGHLSSIGTFTPGGLGATPSGWGSNSRTPGGASGRYTSRYSTSRNLRPHITPRTEGRDASGSAWASPLLTAPRVTTAAARTALAADATGIWHSAPFHSQGSVLAGDGAYNGLDHSAEKEPIQTRSRLRFNFDNVEAHQSSVGDDAPHAAAPGASVTPITEHSEANESPQLSLALFRALVVAAEGEEVNPQAAHVDNDLFTCRKEESNRGSSSTANKSKYEQQQQQHHPQQQEEDGVYIDDPVLRYRRNLTRDGGVYAKTVAHVAKQKQWRAMLQRKDPTCSFQPKLCRTRPKRSSSFSNKAPHRHQRAHHPRRRHSCGSFREEEEEEEEGGRDAASAAGFEQQQQRRRRHSATESTANAEAKARAAEANERAIARGRGLFEHAAVIAHNRQVLRQQEWARECTFRPAITSMGHSMGTRPERYQSAATNRSGDTAGSEEYEHREEEDEEVDEEGGIEEAGQEEENNAAKEGVQRGEEDEEPEGGGGLNDGAPCAAYMEGSWHHARAKADAEELEAIAEVEAQAARFWDMLASSSSSGGNRRHPPQDQGQGLEEERDVKGERGELDLSANPAAVEEGRQRGSNAPAAAATQTQARGRRKVADYAWVGPEVVHEEQAMATAARLHEQTAIIAAKRQAKKSVLDARALEGYTFQPHLPNAGVAPLPPPPQPLPTRRRSTSNPGASAASGATAAGTSAEIAAGSGGAASSSKEEAKTPAPTMTPAAGAGVRRPAAVNAFLSRVAAAEALKASRRNSVAARLMEVEAQNHPFKPTLIASVAPVAASAKESKASEDGVAPEDDKTTDGKKAADGKATDGNTAADTEGKATENATSAAAPTSSPLVFSGHRHHSGKSKGRSSSSRGSAFERLHEGGKKRAGAVARASQKAAAEEAAICPFAPTTAKPLGKRPRERGPTWPQFIIGHEAPSGVANAAKNANSSSGSNAPASNEDNVQPNGLGIRLSNNSSKIGEGKAKKVLEAEAAHYRLHADAARKSAKVRAKAAAAAEEAVAGLTFQPTLFTASKSTLSSPPLTGPDDDSASDDDDDAENDENGEAGASGAHGKRTTSRPRTKPSSTTCATAATATATASTAAAVPAVDRVALQELREAMALAREVESCTFAPQLKATLRRRPPTKPPPGFVAPVDKVPASSAPLRSSRLMLAGTGGGGKPAGPTGKPTDKPTDEPTVRKGSGPAPAGGGGGSSSGPIAGPREYLFADDARPVHERLHAQKVNYHDLRERRAVVELKDCTFTPAILPRAPHATAEQHGLDYDTTSSALDSDSDDSDRDRDNGDENKDADMKPTRRKGCPVTAPSSGAPATAAAAASAAVAAKEDVTTRLCAEANRRAARRELASTLQQELELQRCTFKPHLPALEKREAQLQKQHAAAAKAAREYANQRAANEERVKAAWQATQQRFGGNVRSWSAAYRSGLINVPKPEGEASTAPPSTPQGDIPATPATGTSSYVNQSAAAAAGYGAAFSRVMAESAAAAQAQDRQEVAAGRVPREANFNKWEEQVRTALRLVS